MKKKIDIAPILSDLFRPMAATGIDSDEELAMFLKTAEPKAIDSIANMLSALCDPVFDDLIYALRKLAIQKWAEIVASRTDGNATPSMIIEAVERFIDTESGVAVSV